MRIFAVMKIRNILTYILFAAACAQPVAAKVDLEKYHDEIFNLSVDDNLQSPDVPGKQMAQAQSTMSALKARMEHAGLKTDLTERDGLVLMVTIPAADLFLPNDTMLASFAPTMLKHLLHPLRTPDRFKLLVVAHSDDTGTDDYLYNLTRARADAIRLWIADQQIPVDGVVPYGLGYDEPISHESSRKGRATNRRIEFYFVPGPLLVEELKSKRPAK